MKTELHLNTNPQEKKTPQNFQEEVKQMESNYLIKIIFRQERKSIQNSKEEKIG